MRWMICFALAGCAGTDIKPDEFNVTYGHGDTSGTTGIRASDFESDFGTVGLTWHIGDVAAREREDAYADAIREAFVAQPIAVAAPVPEPTPEPAPEQPKWVTPTLGILSVVLTVLGILNKLGKVSVLSPKGH